MNASFALVLVLEGMLSPDLAELEERGRNHLYNLEYQDARDVFERLTAEAPSSPSGPYYEATAVWLEEFSRRGGMAGSTFRVGRYWLANKREPPSPELDRQFKGLVTEAITRADTLLSKRPSHRDALYFRGAAEGVLSAYHASIEHSYYRSYRTGKRAKAYHEKLLEVDPEYADACLLPGIFQYTVATLPRSLRWAGFLIGLRGNREKGIELVQRAVDGGVRSRWMARLSMSVLDQREKKYRSALTRLRELEARFPKNPLLPFERGSVYILRKDYRRARRVFERILSDQTSGRPNFSRIDRPIVLVKLGETYLFQKRYERAFTVFEGALEVPDVSDQTKAWIFLRRGMAHDGRGQRKAAEWDYRRALKLDADKLTNRLAKRYLKKPFS